jgi:hypothetical protein
MLSSFNPVRHNCTIAQGNEIVGLLKTGSVYYAQAAAAVAKTRDE